jgi:hypothetical protein
LTEQCTDGAIYSNYEGSREKRLARYNQLFLNFKMINVPNHRARLLYGMRNRRSLSESHFGGTFLLTLI